MKILGLSVTVLVLLSSMGVSRASLLNFTFEGTNAAGSLNGTPFTGAELTVSFLGDTRFLQSQNNGNLLSYGSVTNTIDISGIGSGSLNAPFLFVFLNRTTEAVGFGGLSGDLFNLSAPGIGLDTYDLASPFGKFSTTSVQSLSQWDSISTSFGQLTIRSVTVGSFQAGLVPEPSQFALIVLGLAAAGWLARRSLAA